MSDQSEDEGSYNEEGLDSDELEEALAQHKREIGAALYSLRAQWVVDVLGEEHSDAPRAMLGADVECPAGFAEGLLARLSFVSHEVTKDVQQGAEEIASVATSAVLMPAEDGGAAAAPLWVELLSCFELIGESTGSAERGFEEHYVLSWAPVDEQAVDDQGVAPADPASHVAVVEGRRWREAGAAFGDVGHDAPLSAPGAAQLLERCGCGAGRGAQAAFLRALLLLLRCESEPCWGQPWSLCWIEEDVTSLAGFVSAVMPAAAAAGASGGGGGGGGGGGRLAKRAKAS